MIIDAFKDTAGLIPFLAAVYFLIGFLEYRYGERMNHFIMRVGLMGPLAGALVGCIPQCGFSVMASALYVKRLISVGTLLSVFLSTSDEAIPILLSIPGEAGMVAILIAIKFVIAVSAGMAVDAVIRALAQSKSKGSEKASYSEAVVGHPGCCSHGLDNKSSGFKALMIHPLEHTIKIFLFLFILAALFNLVVEGVGEDRIASILLSGSALQPALASLIGLIPNCFASVLLAGLFIKGTIGFGSMVAGLCAGAGLGLLVLVKENKDPKDTFRVIGLLVTISVAAGIVVQFIERAL